MPEKITAEWVAKERKPYGARPRGEEQEQVDRDVAEAHQDTANSQVLTYQIKPEEAEATEKQVAKAARFLGVSARPGQARPGGKRGTVILQWRVKDVNKRAAKTAE